ncbi:MAG TPA: toprim domain-containing protein, partial [Burkholderiaceae bacterium]
DGRSRFKDYSQGVGGGPIDLYMHVRGEDVSGAIRALGEMYRISVEQPASAKAGPPRERTRAEWIADKCLADARVDAHREKLMSYLTGRGIAERTIEHALDRRALGFNTWSSPNVTAGVPGHGGEAVASIVWGQDSAEIVAVDMRYLNPEANGGQKTSSQGEKEGRPWCSDWRRFATAKRVYFVESAINALSIESCQIPGTAAVAVRGTETVKSMDWRMCIGKTAVLAFDNDKPLDHGPNAGYSPGLKAAWAAHEALVALDVPALMIDQEDWLDDDKEPLNDLNDYLQAHGVDKLAAALRKLEPWLIPGMRGKNGAGRPRIFLPFHDFQIYWRYRVREDFTSYVDSYKKDEETGKEDFEFTNVCGFRVAGISRVTIASPTSTMTGDKDTSPQTIFAASVQVPRYGHKLLRRVMQDEQLHNLEVWKKLGPVYSPSGFLRMLNVWERAADIGARDAVNFVGLAWRNGKAVVNEGPDCYFSDPRQQCPYNALVFPSGPRADARRVIEAYQATFTSNAAAQLLVWALGAHLKAFLGFWPHFVMQAEKGAGKSTLEKRLERSIGMTMFSGQSLQTEFRILTSVSYTSHPVGWEEISARKQELINKAVTTLQECYQYTHTRRGADLLDFLLCAPVLLAGEDVPVKSLTGKLVRNQVSKDRRGPQLPDELPKFPVRQWLQYLADTPKARILELHRQCVADLSTSCVAARDDA